MNSPINAHDMSVEKKKRIVGSPPGFITPLRIGVRVPKWATQNAHLVNGIVRFVHEYRKIWQIDADVFFDHELPRNIIDATWDGDGLIVFRCRQEEVSAWRGKGIPVVNISSETHIEGLPNVLVDNYQMGSLAAKYLMGLGLRNFAYVGERSRHYSSQRYLGFHHTLQNNGMTCREINLPISKMPLSKKAQRIHTRLNKALVKLSFPIGLLARDDLLAMNVLRSTQALGINVPDEISLMGINDQSPYCQIAFPRLTSVIHPSELIGYQAAHLLNRMIAGDKVNEDVILESPGITERESTNAVIVQDPLVAKALKYIRQHAKTQPLSVSDICHQIGVSNTTLRLRFKKLIGHSLKAEIDRIRIDEIRLLLTKTQFPIQSIAFQLGFSLPEDLSRFFKRIEGVSPKRYRSSRLSPPTSTKTRKPPI